jgi:hypothetical protein
MTLIVVFSSFPLEPGERVRENPGESGVCLSGVKRSEFSRGPDFPNERTYPQGGFTGCLFFGDFLLAPKESHMRKRSGPPDLSVDDRVRTFCAEKYSYNILKRKNTTS